jgi:hypothetical protein
MFEMFAALCGTGLLFVLIFIKETKGLSETQLKSLYRPDYEEV